MRSVIYYTFSTITEVLICGVHVTALVQGLSIAEVRLTLLLTASVNFEIFGVIFYFRTNAVEDKKKFLKIPRIPLGYKICPHSRNQTWATWVREPGILTTRPIRTTMIGASLSEPHTAKVSKGLHIRSNVHAYVRQCHRFCGLTLHHIFGHMNVGLTVSRHPGSHKQYSYGLNR